MIDTKLKILLADDQSLFAESLKTFLNNYAEDMTVVNIAANGSEAVAMARKYHPDVILMDIRMPEIDGVEAVRKIKEFSPEMKIIMLTTYREDYFIHSALKAGASGYLLKDISPTELIAAIRALNGGVMQISPEIVRQLVEQRYNAQPLLGIPHSGDTHTRTQNKEPDFNNYSIEWLDKLTPREREIFTFLAIGYDNDKIAEKFNLAIQTVRNQVSTIYSKLGVKDRFEIIRLANKTVQ
ncbi:MAG: response regulator transcription factor [Treponema sp.]|nr:response regulator transcription factor [Treponema sp.]